MATERLKILRTADNKSEIVQRKVEDVCKECAIEFDALRMFGSRTYNVFLPTSDIDLVLHLSPQETSGMDILKKIYEYLKAQKDFSNIKNAISNKYTITCTYLSMKVDLTYVNAGANHAPTVFTQRVNDVLDKCDSQLAYADAFKKSHVPFPCRAFCTLVVDWAKGKGVCFRKGTIGTKMKSVHWVLLACVFVDFTNGQFASSSDLDDYLRLFFQFVADAPFGDLMICPFADDLDWIVRRSCADSIYIKGLWEENIVSRVDAASLSSVVGQAKEAVATMFNPEFYDNWTNTNWEAKGTWVKDVGQKKWTFKKHNSPFAIGDVSFDATSVSTTAASEGPRSTLNEVTHQLPACSSYTHEYRYQTQQHCPKSSVSSNGRMLSQKTRAATSDDGDRSLAYRSRHEGNYLHFKRGRHNQLGPRPKKLSQKHWELYHDMPPPYQIPKFEYGSTDLVATASSAGNTSLSLQELELM